MFKVNFIIIVYFMFNVSYGQELFWQADVTTGEFGLVKTNFTISENGGYYSGSSTPDAQKRIIGGIKGALAKGMFQKNGSVIEIDSLIFSGEKFTAYLLLQKKKYFLEGVRENGKIRGEIKGKKSNLIYGHFEATPIAKIVKPKNYESVWNDMKNLTEKYIFKKDILNNKEWRNFVKYMNDFSKVAADDAEFALGFSFKAKDLPFSHYAVEGNKEFTEKYAIAGQQKSQNRLHPTLKLINQKTFLLDVPRFDFRYTEIDSLMLAIVNSNTENLIIDLRNNSGGDFEGAMRICQYLIDKPIYGGIMLSQVYWNKNVAPPAVEDYKNFKSMNTANYAWYKNEVKNNVEGLCIMATPLDKKYEGNIFILTSNNTASTSEPFVYTLQNYNLAKVIGAKTAGAMLSMEYFSIENLTISIPMLDYYTSDGKRLDKIGVEPNISCDPLEALNVALKEINKN